VTIGIAIIVVLLVGIVSVGLLLLGIGLVMLVMRGRAVAPAPPRAPPSPPQRVQQVVASVPPLASAPPPRPAPAPAHAPLGSNSGLLGFFDDEPYVSPGQAPREVESAKTELFQRGKMAIDWDEEEDEGEATEIFSAHGAAGDLAEFAFDDDEQSTGYPKGKNR
jgi:hypothetical protein